MLTVGNRFGQDSVWLELGSDRVRLGLRSVRSRFG